MFSISFGTMMNDITHLITCYVDNLNENLKMRGCQVTIFIL